MQSMLGEIGKIALSGAEPEMDSGPEKVPSRGFQPEDHGLG